MKPDEIHFLANIAEIEHDNRMGRTVHVLLVNGQMQFTLAGIDWTLVAADYLILPSGLLIENVRCTDDCEYIAFSLTENSPAIANLKSDFDVLGHISLLQNPVIRLSTAHYRRFHDDLQRMQLRSREVNHTFRDEMLSHLLSAHVLDIYDVHLHSQSLQKFSTRKMKLLRSFLLMLHNGAHIRNRELSHFASELCISPHYLSEICVETTGLSARYWIDRFTVREIIRQLSDKSLTLTQIADNLNFTTLSYFSRYVTKHLGRSPQSFRNANL